MSRFEWLRSAGPVAGLVACMCAGVTVLIVSFVTAARRMTPSDAPVRTIAVSAAPSPQDRVAELPDPGDRATVPAAPRPKSVATPAEQAAAGNQVIARAIAQALGEAAATDNARAVEDLLRGLPKYGEAAEQAIQEELGRVKSPKARDALLKALDKLRS